MDIRQIKTLTLANMKARYRKTVAGFIWVVLNPIILYGVQSFVFKKFLKLDMPDYALFLLGGLIPWIFITSTLDMSASYLLVNGSLLKSFKIPPPSLIISLVLDNFINFLFAFMIILVPVYIHAARQSLAVLLIPIPVFTLIISIVSLSYFFSVLNIFYRDTKFVLNFALNIMFFITPIFYPVDYIPEQYKWIIEVNPLFHLINPFRIAIYEFSWNAFIISQLKGFGTAILSVTLAITYWKKKQNEFYIYL